MTANLSFYRYNQDARLDDLPKPGIQAFLQEIESELAADAPLLSIESLARQMNLAGGPTESPWPKNVGLLFFNEHPDRFFPGLQIDVVWFPEGASGDRFEEKTFKGPLARMTREALNYIQRNFLIETVVKHADRAEVTRIWNFPYAAIEEALVNAVYHRSYEEHEPIEMRISHDELVIISYPGPDRSIRLEELRTGRAVSRRYRNRRIGEFLKELDLTEGRSTGIPKILKVMAANGSSAPVFETDDERLSFVVRLPSHPALRADLATTEQVTEQVHRLLTTMRGDMSRQDLLDALGMTHREHFRSAYLKPALDAGWVEMTLPDKPNSSKQRYRLTSIGQRWLKAHPGNSIR